MGEASSPTPPTPPLNPPLHVTKHVFPALIDSVYEVQLTVWKLLFSYCTTGSPVNPIFTLMPEEVAKQLRNDFAAAIKINMRDIGLIILQEHLVSS